MSVFTAKKLKEARNLAGMSQDEAANAMKISRRRLQTSSSLRDVTKSNHREVIINEQIT